jgi:hypothetical protein
MNIPYFRGPYDPDIDDTQSGGGLLALLQAAMQRRPIPSADPAANSTRVGGYGLPDARMLVRPVSLQGDQDSYRPARADTAPTQSPAAGDFRQVSRAPIALRPQRAIDASTRASDGVGLSSSEDGGGAPDSFDLGASSLSHGNSTRASTGNVNSPNLKMAQVALPLPGGGLPLPPIPGGAGRSQPLPHIPALPVPDSLRDLWAIYQLQRGALSGGFGGGNDNYNRCVRAVDGGTDDWENFCKYLDRAPNNTVGGESQNRACWSKTYESRNQKKQWCENQFGSHD